MPASQRRRQLRWCGTPSTVTRHSMQMPIPQSGPRAWPETENRHGSPAIITAAATLVPASTTICFPFTVMGTSSLLN
jgi:hypothetical protein